MNCIYCEQPMNPKSDRVRKAQGDADGITEIHYQMLANRYIPTFVTTEDGAVCPDCLNEAKKEKKAKREKKEHELPLVAEMRAKREKIKAKKKEVPNAN